MRPPADWQNLPFFEHDLPRIEGTLADEANILPPANQRFAALDACSPEQTRVVILGQDPYPTPGHAHGFAFSVEPEIPLPRSLNNVFKEMDADIGAHPATGDLRHWAAQGVLLLNTSLTVPAGQAGAHAKLGWSALTAQVLASLSDRPRAFLLWGKHAQSFAHHIEGDNHLILATAHPSPLSARRGFFGSRPFSRINDWLMTQGQPQIDWTGEVP
ncbi:uracil-DNA glycosylase [Sagittula sp. NFXS13]|uniref:uracil-DNA glycosylase n=1 Tax=Sagittula sp. NFXS13 TaxID=2819095 RepID=UPI0032E00C3D